MGIATQVIGADRAARATQRAATDASNMAREQQRQARLTADQLNTDLVNLSRATPQELRAYEGSLKAAEDQLSRQEKMLQAIDPSIMEASSQLLSILKGESAGIGGGLSAQRAQQRNQLLNTLRAQLGPGAETTAAGQRALRNFDMETSVGAEQMRSGTVGTLMGLLSGKPDNSKALAGLMQAGSAFGGLQERQIGARQAGGQAQLSALMGTGQNVIDTSGAGAVANQLIGRSREQMGRSIFSGVTGMVGMFGSKSKS